MNESQSHSLGPFITKFCQEHVEQIYPLAMYTIVWKEVYALINFSKDYKDIMDVMNNCDYNME